MRRLLIRPGAIGDFLVSLPALECLRAEYTEVWAGSQNLPLARCADRTRSIAATGLDLLGITEPAPQLLDTLRGFDSIVSWYGANRPEFREVVASLGLPFRFFPALPADANVHAVDYYLAQARAIEACQSDGVPRLQVPAHGTAGHAVIHPFSGSRRKNWPFDKFLELARRLENVLPVTWCAGPEDELPGAVRFENLYELACWLAGARIYIGNDSGISHLAAAAGTPVVVLFGASDPRVWAPRGGHVRVVGAWGRPMYTITVDEVRQAVLAGLS